MATETVSADGVMLSRADFDQIRNALGTAVDSIVALQELCTLGHDAMGSGLGFALESVIKRQEDAICDAHCMLHDKYVNREAAA